MALKEQLAAKEREHERLLETVETLQKEKDATHNVISNISEIKAQLSEALAWQREQTEEPEERENTVKNMFSVI